MGSAISHLKSSKKSSKKSSSPEKMAAPVAFNYYEQAQKNFKPPCIANGNAFLGDVYSSDKVDSKAPVTCGFYRQESGTPLVYTYDYDEMKVILEGEIDIQDETGQKVHATPGDVFWFPKGAKITFTTPSYGLAFYVR
ncbi:MAG: hypothetical protein M1834_009254 [Cirrosporium novae-zelandiae]|nr:MAG: hypothetical protein M1834_009254 [Cirrosporium novae-zelandiae]